MDEEKQKLIKKAKKKYERMDPLGNHKTFEKCFTTVRGKLHFWFNTKDGTTKMLIQENGNGNLLLR